MATATTSNIANLLLRRERGPGKPLLSSHEIDGEALSRQLDSWKEADFLQHCSAEYASFQPAPRSTIALCYNCDGSLLASTHGDHTVKITSCHTGTLSRVLSGHRRTPWVVRFHPRHTTLLASGSLDHEVRLWDASTGQCIAKHTFGKPIASLAFHVSASVLAIGCGHKLYMWEYTTVGATPVIVLKTRRSIRAVHFHPHSLPMLLTAEVQDPTPTPELLPTITELEGSLLGGQPSNADNESRASFSPKPETTQGVAAVGSQGVPAHVSAGSSAEPRAGEWPYVHQNLPPSMVPVGWEVPFPAAVPRVAPPAPAATADGQGDAGADGAENMAAQLAAANYANVWNILGEEQPPRVRLRLWRYDEGKPSTELDETHALRLTVSDAVLCSEMGVHFSPCGRFIAATVACRGPLPASAVDAAAVAVGQNPENMEWSPARVPHASEGQQQQPLPLLRMGSSGGAAGAYITASPGTHLPRPERVVFEVRVISISGATFGDAVKARRIRGAHCLTSVQFSPAGDHVLLAYGKKHSSLLRSLVADRGALLPLHTILEVLRLSDMELVRVLPSSEDEINAACFHPLPGGGLAYGTKEGRLRLVTHDRQNDETDGKEPGDAGALESGEQRPNLRDLQALGLAFMQQQWLQQGGGAGAGAGGGAQ